MPLSQEEKKIKLILVKRARKGLTIDYSELCVEARLQLFMEIPEHRAQIGHLLGNISSYEVLHGRPMLSSIVVGKNSSLPGQGYFDLAKELYEYDYTDEEFFIDELKDTIEFWRKDSSKARITRLQCEVNKFMI